jgi:hypothetical protein
VTDRATVVPPSRPEIEAEIAVADERRMRGDQENRADAAATILRWLIGRDDHVPVRGKNRGELVGGSGDIVRTGEQIAEILTLASHGQRQAAAKIRDIGADAGQRQFAQQQADHLDGVTATLAWVLGARAESPLTRLRDRKPTLGNLKSERLQAEDVIEHARQPWLTDQLSTSWYGAGVGLTISWLLGDSTDPPVKR